MSSYAIVLANILSGGVVLLEMIGQERGFVSQL